MCHGSCATCTDGFYSSCLTCISSRYIFKNTCNCPDNYFSNDDFSCSAQSSSIEGLWVFMFVAEAVVLVLAMIALMNKVNAPLTRKLIDISQSLGLLLYLDIYLDQKTISFLKLFQMANLTYFFPNYFAEHFYGEDINTNNTSLKYLNMSSVDQTPKLKFQFFGKGSNFAMNQAQVALIWLIGLVLFLFVGVFSSCFSKVGRTFGEFLSTHFKNFIFLMFYVTFQESILNVILQLANLEFSQTVNIVGFVLMVVYGILCWIIVRSILLNLNKYPEVQLDRLHEIELRRSMYPFIYLFEGPVYTNAIVRNRIDSSMNKSENTSTSSNWMIVSLLVKIALVAFTVLQYSYSAQTSLLIVAVVFLALFVLMSPVQKKLLWVLMVIADAYFILAVALFPNYDTDYTHLFWPGYALILIAILIEIFLAFCIYRQSIATTPAEQQSVRVIPKLSPGKSNPGNSPKRNQQESPPRSVNNYNNNNNNSSTAGGAGWNPQYDNKAADYDAPLKNPSQQGNRQQQGTTTPKQFRQVRQPLKQFHQRPHPAAWPPADTRSNNSNQNRGSQQTQYYQSENDRTIDDDNRSSYSRGAPSRNSQNFPRNNNNNNNNNNNRYGTTNSPTRSPRNNYNQNDDSQDQSLISEQELQSQSKAFLRGGQQRAQSPNGMQQRRQGSPLHTEEPRKREATVRKSYYGAPANNQRAVSPINDDANAGRRWKTSEDNRALSPSNRLPVRTPNRI